MDRKQHLMSVKESMAQGTPPASPMVVNVSDQKIKMHGRIAVLSDLVSIEDIDSNTGITPGRYLQTEVWKKEDERWKIVQMHYSVIMHGM